MAETNYLLATAGHVDHGKSALVKVLTGRDPDRLPEEKARGITIDLGFAHLRLPVAADVDSDPCRAFVLQTPGSEFPSINTDSRRLQDRRPTTEPKDDRRLQDRRPAKGGNLGRDRLIPPGDTSALTSGATTIAPGGFARENEDPTISALNVGIVDVPGHEDFIKNMVAGIGAIDAALLVVAADDGWMPQTEEHLQILEYAGVRHGLVALTKIDRIAPAARAGVIAAVRAQLAGTAFADSPIVPTSTLTGEGLPELRAGLAACLIGAPPAPDIGKPRLWVDRAFSLRGVGTVVTGSLRGGGLAAGQEVAIGPHGALARIRTLQQHNQPRPAAAPGTRTALNLVGVAAGADVAAAVDRGDLVTVPGFAAAHETCDVLLSRSVRAPLLRGGDRPLAHGTQLQLHVGTTSVPCRIILPGPQVLPPGGRCVAQLRLAWSLPIVPGERVILREAAGRVTLAGGVVLDAGSRRTRFRQSAQQAFLAAVAAAPDDCQAWLAATLRRDGFVGIAGLHAHGGFADAAIGAAADALVRAGTAIRREKWIGLNERWQALGREAVELIGRHEREHPTQNGLPLPQLQAALGGGIPPEAFESLIGELTAADFERAGAAIRHRGFRPTLPASLRAAADEVSTALRRARLNPPARQDLARGAAAAEALEFLIKTGRVVALSSEIVLLAPVYSAAVREVCAHLAVHGRATVSELKPVLGVSRRVMVPLLERMDRDGLTRREGEHRVLRQPPPAAAGDGLPARSATMVPRVSGAPA